LTSSVLLISGKKNTKLSILYTKNLSIATATLHHQTKSHPLYQIDKRSMRHTAIYSATVTALIASIDGFTTPFGVSQRFITAIPAKTLEGREIEGELKPTNNFILVKKAKIQDQTSGGILLTGKVRFLALLS